MSSVIRGAPVSASRGVTRRGLDAHPRRNMLVLALLGFAPAMARPLSSDTGMSDTELLLHNFLFYSTANEPNASVWPAIWQLNGLQDPLQTGQTALRYSLDRKSVV